MSYNKAKEQKKWEEWKEKEENILRSENFEENKITILREYDWKSFKEERCYRTNEHITKDVFFEMSKSTELVLDESLDQILDNLSNEELYKQVKNADSLLKEILFLKISGFEIKEIADILEVTPKAIYHRIERFQKKLKKHGEN